MLSATRLQEIDDVLGDFCRREPAASVRTELEYVIRIDGNAVTLFERRPAFRVDVGWTESPVARFRFVAKRSTWELLWRDRNLQWHHYAPRRSASRLATLFAEVRRDPTAIFWG